MCSTFIYFGREHGKYHDGEKEEQGLAIGGYESAFLANLSVFYLFEKSKNLLNPRTYHGIYQYDGLLVFKGNKSVQYINIT